MYNRKGKTGKDATHTGWGTSSRWRFLSARSSSSSGASSSFPSGSHPSIISSSNLALMVIHSSNVGISVFFVTPWCRAMTLRLIRDRCTWGSNMVAFVEPSMVCNREKSTRIGKRVDWRCNHPQFLGTWKSLKINLYLSLKLILRWFADFHSRCYQRTKILCIFFFSISKQALRRTYSYPLRDTYIWHVSSRSASR